MRFLGVDLAWGEGSVEKRPNLTGVVALAASGRVIEAGWTTGVSETVEWVQRAAAADALLFVDAPLVVDNPTGQRVCDRQVGERYGRWKVSCNSINLGSPRLAGVALRERLENLGWAYSDGCAGPPTGGRAMSECYPYTAIVGADELGYESERPRYKRKPKSMRIAEFRPVRARAADELIRRLAALVTAEPPLDLRSQPLTNELVASRSPLADVQYKKREDLLDAAICAWTAAFWARWGTERCQVLGLDDGSAAGVRGTVIAPARPEQRR
jgi:predicted RNase H-like nuclease